MPEISSREFAAEPLKVKQLARGGPVVVTNRGRPELVILRYEWWRALVPQDVPEDLIDALGAEDAADVELAVPRPELAPRPIDLDD
jgi:PHD/YefM family antitoxin component YafN of YafNO toxin-antitoxin module